MEETGFDIGENRIATITEGVPISEMAIAKTVCQETDQR
jgi:hypothetical protein